MSTKNANLDCIALGSGAAAAGIGAKIPIVASLAESVAAVDGTFKSAKLLATALPAAAPILTIGGLIIVGYELLKK